jgi:hypothetical protein
MSSSDILEMAENYYKPRVSLSSVAKARAEKTEQKPPAPVTDVNYNARKLVMLIITVPFLCFRQVRNTEFGGLKIQSLAGDL